MKRDEIKKELEIIKERNDGIIRAQDIVDYARNPNTALHTQFEWDDSIAAEKFRIQQARQVLRVFVSVVKNDQPPIRTFVSLDSDRLNRGGGYRDVGDVLKTTNGRTQLIQQALREFTMWKNKFELLQELIPIFEEAEKLTARYTVEEKEAA